MRPTSRAFKQNAAEALQDQNLQAALSDLEGGFVEGRKNAVERLPEFDQLRAAGRRIKLHVLENLDVFKQSGGTNRGLMREFKGIAIDGTLTVTLKATVGLPVISGVEVVAEP